MKIVVDSGCDLTEDMKNYDKYKITKVPLTLQLGDEQFIDDESLDVTGYVKKMTASQFIPKTAAPSPDLYLENYRGDESTFVVTLSSLLSASYSNAMIAKDMYVEEIGSKFVHVFDSLVASSGEAIIALKINELIKNKLTEVEIVEQVTKFIENMKTYFILDNYTNSVKNGRMNPYVAKLATLLSIKPICHSNKGKMEVLDKARGLTKAFDKLIKYIEEHQSDFENRILGISHVSCLQKALDFKEAITKKIKFKDVIIFEASGLCSTYADDGGIIITV